MKSEVTLKSEKQPTLQFVDKVIKQGHEFWHLQNLAAKQSKEY